MRCLREYECSTAAGAYQILYGTWKEKFDKGLIVVPAGKDKFGPEVQNRIAVMKLYDRGALNPIRKGEIEKAIPAKIGIPVVEGDMAAVEIISDLRLLPIFAENVVWRIVWFLNKTPVGWRIVNGLYFENWPIKDGKCWGEFGSPPTPWQKQFEASQCKPGFVDKERH